MGDQLGSGQATAPIRFRQFNEFEAVDHLQQIARLFPDSLSAAQVTGIVVGYF